MSSRCARGAFVALVLLSGVSGHGAPPAGARHTALILYDGTSAGHREGTIDAAHISNLLGHFDYRGTSRPIEQYRPGDMRAFDAVFVVGGSEKTSWPAALVAEARQRTSTTIWIGSGVDALLANGEGLRRGLRVERVLDDGSFDRVRYRGVIVDKGGDTLTEMTVLSPSAVVDAVALDARNRERPYIVHTGPLWIVADVPFAFVNDHDRYLVFCDLLHDMLGVRHDPSKRALIRIEDVHPEDDPANIRRTAAVFAAEGVPFQIGLVPIYRAPSGAEVYLSDRPDVVAALHEAVARGGTIVLHGSTHQFRGTTPDDVEFWDDAAGRPRPDDTPELVQQKLAVALDECIRNDLYPIAWETPHYTASQIDYGEIARVFSTIYERPMVTDWPGTQQAFPFPSVEAHGAQVVPENLGYLVGADPTPEDLLDNARALAVVRDGVASAYVHDFIDPRFLHETVRGLKNLGYRFISLRDFPCRVATGNRVIATAGASRSLALEDEFLHQFIVTPDGSRRGETRSATRQSTTTETSLVPGAGEILVAAATPEGPLPRRASLSRIGSSIATFIGGIGRRTSTDRAAAAPPAIAIVWQAAASGEAANDQSSFANVFRAYGVRSRFVQVGDVRAGVFSRDEIVVVPSASARALAPAQAAAIAEFVRAGGGVVTDGRSSLAEGLGVLGFAIAILLWKLI